MIIENNGRNRTGFIVAVDPPTILRRINVPADVIQYYESEDVRFVESDIQLSDAEISHDEAGNIIIISKEG